MDSTSVISVRGARQHHLKNINLDLPLGKMIVLTGVSGSGKSSLAMDTLHAEGHRRYTETFSPYTRQFLEKTEKPQVDSITGIPPSIAIGQVNPVRNSRSTVGTLTEVADYLKLLFQYQAQLICPTCQRPVKRWTVDTMAEEISHTFKQHSRILILSPLPPEQHTQSLLQQGYTRLWIEGITYRLDDPSNASTISKARQAYLVHDRLSPDDRSRLLEGLTQALTQSQGLACVVPESSTQLLTFSNQWVCPHDGTVFENPVHGMFSFNNPAGACEACRGFGRCIEIDEGLVIPNASLTIAQGAARPFQTKSFADCQRDLLRFCKRAGISTSQPYRELPEEHRRLIWQGEANPSETLQEVWERGGWYGIKGFFDWLETRTYKMHVRVMLSKYRAYRTCTTCGGTRFKPHVLAWHLHGKTIAQVNATSLQQLQQWLKGIKPLPQSEIPYEQVSSRIAYMVDVGLGYLTLDRSARTLSGGEFQRVNLTACLGTSLVNTLFVLDEPSIGLHPRDTQKLTQSLHRLRDLGNTILVVEHDESVMLAGDQIVEMGPLQGSGGGEVVFQGTPQQLLKAHTLTGDYLSGKKRVTLPPRTRKLEHWLKIGNASKHNIQHLSFELPLNCMAVVTGVSGSGKSTLVHEILYKALLQKLGQNVDEAPQLDFLEGHEAISQVTLVDQTPLTQTPRSTPALYMGTYDSIRQLFGTCEEAKRLGLNPSMFSFNSPLGRCERCAGMGYERIEMQFLSDLYLLCPVCEGKRFQKFVLDVEYEGKSIHQVLNLTVHDAIHFFSSGTKETIGLRKKIVDSLQLLIDVGLGYLALGQPLHQLSGGEAQRLKLVSHLKSHHTKIKGTHLILLDEPTTGLHAHDVQLLLQLLQRMVDAGHSLLIIEHHLDVIAQADWVLDLGPEAGDGGGKIVAQGTPQQIAQTASSLTGKFLKERIGKKSHPLPAIKKTPKKSSNAIQILSARHHNLKNISLDIPREKIVVITGLSGSGKSTLAFDLLFSEGQRRYLDCLNAYARQFVEQMEKPAVDAILGIPPTVAIEQRTSRGGGKSTVATVTELYQFLRLLYSKVGTQHDPKTGEPAIQQSADVVIQQFKNTLKKENSLTLCIPLIKGRKGFHTEVAEWAERKGIETLLVDKKRVSVKNFKKLDRYKEHHIDAVLGMVEKSTHQSLNLARQALAWGKGVFYTLDSGDKKTLFSTELFCPQSGRSFEPLDPRMFSFNSPHGWCPKCQGFGSIVSTKDEVATSLEMQTQQELQRETEEIQTLVCPECHGARLNETSRAVRLHGTPITQLHDLTVDEFAQFFNSLRWTSREREIVANIAPEISQRLQFLQKVGLGYLTLNRSAPTLSGGEAQRIRLASQLGSNLRGVLYILDEPTIGLHARDNQELLSALKELNQRGNSLVIVEHDEETMRTADWILDLGPGAGVHGGQVVAQGTFKQITQNKKSLTGQLLRAPLQHPLKGCRRSVTTKTESIRITGARVNNLKNIDVKIPLQRLNVICGVSGAGKSTLMHEVIYPVVKHGKCGASCKRATGHQRIQRVVEVDQSPIGKTSRSTVATYLGVMDTLRQIFARLPQAQAQGLTASDFSYNSGRGRCTACQGQGFIKMEMNFLPPTYVPCEVCEGKRWSSRVLEVCYKEKNIHQVLELSVDEACEFFDSITTLSTPLRLLKETGLGYLKLGQTSPTLSGGEAQRMKLVTELSGGAIAQKKEFLKTRYATKASSLYLLEEPTVGLHLADVKLLIDVLHRLVDEGHTVVVIEHHLNVIAEADYVIELGPQSGAGGGQIVFQGTPEDLILCKTSATAKFLKNAFPSSRNALAKKA